MSAPRSSASAGSTGGATPRHAEKCRWYHDGFFDGSADDNFVPGPCTCGLDALTADAAENEKWKEAMRAVQMTGDREYLARFLRELHAVVGTSTCENAVQIAKDAIADAEKWRAAYADGLIGDTEANRALLANDARWRRLEQGVKPDAASSVHFGSYREGGFSVKHFVGATRQADTIGDTLAAAFDAAFPPDR